MPVLSLSSIKALLIVCTLTTITLVAGCRDTDEHASAKQAHAAVKAAMKEFAAKGDFVAAQKTLKQALSGDSVNSGEQNVVSLVEGSLKYGQADQLGQSLDPNWASIRQNLEELSGIAGQIIQVRLEKEYLESTLRSRQEEQKQLGVQLDGDATSPGGIAAKLKDAQTKLADLKSQQRELSQKFNETLKQATTIQRQADELLAKAELAQGDKKADLQKQAYAVLLGTGDTTGKNAYLAEAQQLKDQLDTTESEIALVGPKVATFTAQSEKIRTRIDELDKSDFATKSNERLTTIGSLNTSFQEEFAGILGQIKQTQELLAEKMQQITDMFLAAQKDFKKITSDESLRDFARIAAAEASASEARVRSDYAFSQRQLAARLTILSSTDATDSLAEIKTLAQRYLDDSDEYAAKAIADYNNASNLYGKIPVGKNDFAVAVLKKRIFVLAQKAYLAERVENMDVKNDTLNQAKDLIDKAVKFDPTFESSLSSPPYNILTGKAPATVAIEKKTVAPPAEATPPIAEPNVEEVNTPVTEPNESVAEPNVGEANTVTPNP
ncbi:MAG: hypothetical protein Q7T18_07835 [Sedimentisphaerales bacterium]|nr:hypothetical protein [Sedimentisphaerales bacterium]